MNSDIINYRNEIIADMKKNPQFLSHFVNSDEARSNDYAGREVFELLQNAVDAGGRVKIELESNTFTVSNSGEPFGIDNIKALMISDNSTKSNDADLMGYKGVGFRAALNISEDISVHSNSFHLRFSEEAALKIQNDYKLGMKPPMMFCPEETDDVLKNDYTTNIVIKINEEDHVDRVRKQMLNIEENTILFLKEGFESLEVVIDGERNTFLRTRKVTGKNEALVTITHNGESTTLREFFEEGVLDDYEDERDKKYHLSVVYSPKQINDNKLYSYFLTDVDFPMHYWYAHGTFNLTNNRNQLVKNTRNRVLMERLIQLICDSSTKISDEVDYIGYKILRSHGYFSSSVLEDTDLNAILERKIDNALIMPTVNNNYVALNSGPVFYDLNFQKYLIDMPGNDALLKFTNDKEVVTYLGDDIGKPYKFEVVADYLDGIVDAFSNQDRVTVARLLHRYYGDELNFSSIAPNFFTDERGNEIQNGSILIKSPALDKLVLPGFMKLRYINSEQLKLAKQYNDDKTFVSSDFAKAYGIKIADIDEILDNMNRLVKNDTKLIPNYVRWLFDNRETLRSAPFNNYYILTKNREIRRTDGLYFSKKYIKGTPLEKYYDSSKIVADPTVFKIKPGEVEEFTDFLKEELDIADCPRRRDGSLEGLETILEVGNTKDIINLLLSNRDYLSIYIRQSDARSLFRTTKWITKKGRRYAPKDVIVTSRRNYHRINDYIKDDFLFISQDELLSKIQMEGSTKVWLIDEYLCFNTELYDLNNKYIYKILNELPVFDPSGEISEDVYKDVIRKNDDREKPSINLTEFCNFANNGKVFCLDKKYHKAKDCLYLGEKYPNIIESEHNFINIVKGRSASAIWDRFHIEELSVDYELHSYNKSKSNTVDFKTDLDNYKVSLLAEHNDYFDSEEKIGKLRDMAIVLCDSLTIEYEDKTGALDDYEFVNAGNTFYVKVPNKTFSELKRDDKFQDALSEVFRFNYGGLLDKDATARAIGRDINSRIERTKSEFGNNAWSDAEAKLSLATVEDKDYSSENAEILINLRDKHFEEYERRLYSKLKNAPIEEKMSFVAELNAYRDREFDINDIPTEKGANMLDYLYGAYPLFNEKIVMIKDINKRRIETYNELCDDFPDYVDILKQLLEYNHLESLLRFGEVAQIRSEMLALIDKLEKSKKRDDAELIRRLSVTDDEDEGGGEELVTETDEEIEDESTGEEEEVRPTQSVQSTVAGPDSGQGKPHISKVRAKSIHYNIPKILGNYMGAQFVNYDDVAQRSQKSGSSNINHPMRRMSLTARKAQEDRAKKAEKIALAELEKLGYTGIVWMSAYAKDEGVNLNGADGYGYDIQCAKNDEIRYIEVKSSLSSTGVEFEMTENELDFCSLHAKNYDVMYVYGMSKDSPRITLIENVFYKINDSNKAPASYRITLK